MAAEAKREPGLLRRWLQKLRESWRRAGAIDQRADKGRRTYENRADSTVRAADGRAYMAWSDSSTLLMSCHLNRGLCQWPATRTCL
jgi:hypothetical protein